MIKFKEKQHRPVQIADCLSLVVVLVAVFIVKPEKRNIFYDAYVLAVLVSRPLVPILFRNLKFRNYMVVRYLILSFGIGFATILFQIFS